MTDSQTQRQQRRQRKANARSRAKAYVAERKTAADYRCSVCRSPAHRLEYHHINAATKRAAVSDLVHDGYSTAAIAAEIAKCVLVCRGCHAELHFGAVW